MFEAAIERGELPADVDRDEIVRDGCRPDLFPELRRVQAGDRQIG